MGGSIPPPFDHHWMTRLHFFNIIDTIRDLRTYELIYFVK
jgi:hypothetical protein